MYRVQIKPFEYILLTKSKIDKMILNGTLDKNKIWIEFQPRLHLDINIIPEKCVNIKLKAEYVYKSTVIDWNFDKLCEKAVNNVDKIQERIKTRNAQISFVVYSSFRCPGIILDNKFVKFAHLLNLSIDFDLYPIYSEKYRYEKYPWHV